MVGKVEPPLGSKTLYLEIWWSQRTPEGFEEWQCIAPAQWLDRDGGNTWDGATKGVHVGPEGIPRAEGEKGHRTTLYASLRPPRTIRIDWPPDEPVVCGVRVEEDSRRSGLLGQVDFHSSKNRTIANQHYLSRDRNTWCDELLPILSRYAKSC
jgi:hypothetical protein